MVDVKYNNYLKTAKSRSGSLGYGQILSVSDHGPSWSLTDHNIPRMYSTVCGVALDLLCSLEFGLPMQIHLPIRPNGYIESVVPREGQLPICGDPPEYWST